MRHRLRVYLQRLGITVGAGLLVVARVSSPISCMPKTAQTEASRTGYRASDSR